MLVWNLITLALGITAIVIWVLPLREWAKLPSRARLWSIIAMPCTSLCAALWVFSILYSAAGADLGDFASEAGGKRTAIGYIFRVAALTGIFGFLSASGAYSTSHVGRMWAMPLLAFFAFGVWMFWGTITF